MKLAVALGGNLGDVAATLRTALADLGIAGEVTAVSPLYRSEPVGGPDQPSFLNAVAVLETSLPIEQVLGILQGIEARHGRVRGERWGPRTLDLDIIASDQGEYHAPHLQVPHPRAIERRFVLEPLAEIWPEAIVSATEAGSRTARAALGDVLDQHMTRLEGDLWYQEPGRGAGWVAAQVVIFGAALAAAVWDGGSAGDMAWLPWVGRAAIAAGALEMVLGLRALGRNLTAFPEPLEDATLVRTGIYRLARHPIYGANVLLLVGLGLHQSSVAGIIVGGAAAAFFWAKAGHEEERLARRYPGYEEYRAVVSHRLIPWVL